MSYIVQKPFDQYSAGQQMTAEDVADQERRGNIPDLLRNGFIVKTADELPYDEDAPDYEAMSYRELQQAAKDAGIPANQSTEKLIEALENGSN